MDNENDYGYAGDDPGYAGGDSGYAGDDPDYGGKAPGYAGRDSEYAGTAPEYAGGDPGYTGGDPGYAGTDPRYTESKTAYAEDEPVYAGDASGYAGNSGDENYRGDMAGLTAESAKQENPPFGDSRSDGQYGFASDYSQSGYQRNDYTAEGYQSAEGPQYSQPQRQSNMALASLVMGILGIVTSCCCFGGMIFGGLGILFALLSRLSDRYEGYAKAGLITSIVAVVLAFTAGIAVTVYYIVSLFETGGAF